jgi:hypothetical protein
VGESYPFYRIAERKNSKRPGLHRFIHVTFEEYQTLGDSKARWLEYQRIRNRRERTPEELVKTRELERKRYSDPDFRDRHNAKRRAYKARLRAGRPRKKPGRKPKVVTELVKPVPVMTNVPLAMTSEERSADAKAKVQGAKDRQKLIDALLEVLTSDSADSETLREARACAVYFPEGKQLIDRIVAAYGDKPELLKTVLLCTVVNAIEKLV